MTYICTCSSWIWTCKVSIQFSLHRFPYCVPLYRKKQQPKKNNLHLIISSWTQLPQVVQLILEWSLENSPCLESGPQRWIQGVSLVRRHRQAQSNDTEFLVSSGNVPRNQCSFTMLLEDKHQAMDTYIYNGRCFYKSPLNSLVHTTRGCRFAHTHTE